MRMSPRFLFSFLATLLCLSFGSCEVVSGTIKTDAQYEFLAKFCFVRTGYANMKIDASGLRGVKVNVFLDVDWPKVYKKNLPCDQFVSHAQQSIRLDDKGDDFRFNFRETKRPHYWYLTVSHCTGEEPLEVHFVVDFINSGGRWDQQFSFDQQGLVGISFCFLLAFVLLLATHSNGLVKWWEAERYFHPILKMLTASMACETISLFLEFFHFCAFAYNGIGFPWAYTMSRIFDVAAQLLLITIVILIAKGWTISTAELHHANFILGILGLLSGSYLMLFMYDVYFRNPASTVYIYDSYPGYAILLIRMATCFWFLKLIGETRENEYDEQKRSFYAQFQVAFTIWFVYLPIIVLVSVFLDAWVREKTVVALYQIMNFLAYSAMTYLLWPTKAAKYFKIATPSLIDDSAADGL